MICVLGLIRRENDSLTNISDRISDRAHPIWRNMMIHRNQMWGHLPMTDECFDIFEEVKKVVGDAKKILEIGFNIGASCSMQLDVFPNSEIHTYDPIVWKWWVDMQRQPDRNIRDHFWREGTYVDLATLSFGDRFHFYNHSSEHLLEDHVPDFFDYAFIDGHHDYHYVKSDIYNCRQLRIPYLLMDNLNIPDVSRAINETEALELVFEKEYTQRYPNDDRIILDRMGLYKVHHEHILS